MRTINLVLFILLIIFLIAAIIYCYENGGKGGYKFWQEVVEEKGTTVPRDRQRDLDAENVRNAAAASSIL